MAGVDLEKMKRRMDEIQRRKEGGGDKYFKSVEGKNRIRILPPKGEDGDFCKEARLHYGLSEKPFGCPRDLGKECPACNLARKLFKSTDPGDVQLARKLNAKLRFYCNVIDRKSEDPKPQIFSFGPMIHDQVLAYFADDEWGDITDAKKGYDLIIERTGTDLETKYTIRTAKEPSAVEDIKALMKKYHDLDEEISYLDEDEINEVLQGAAGPTGKKKKKDEDEEEDDSDSGDDSDDEDAPKSKKKSKDEDEEEEDDDDKDSDSDEDSDDDDDSDSEDEDSEDEDEKPKSKKSKDDDDDEDSDSDDDDDDDKDDEDDSEDEDEKPKSKKKSKDDEDDSEDEDEEDDRPKKKKAKGSKDDDEEGDDKEDVKKALARLRSLKPGKK